MSTETFIEIKGLTRWYRDASEPAVDQLNLQIGKSEIFGLLGPNGAGKTTVISILCNQIDANSGTIKIAGKNLKKERGSIKKMIGVVPQDIALYPTLTAYENLNFFGKMYGLSGSKLKDTIKQNMHDFGLENKPDKKINTFSGGMKRRINLIAGILHKPQILFLDEPTVGIDVQSKNVILEYLKKMNRVEGTTIIYTSHLMEEAERFCTQIGILDRGKLIAEGKPKEMIEEFKTCENLEDIYLLLTGRSLRD